MGRLFTSPVSSAICSLPLNPATCCSRSVSTFGATPGSESALRIDLLVLLGAHPVLNAWPFCDHDHRRL
jgi:hypothetical protein